MVNELFFVFLLLTNFVHVYFLTDWIINCISLNWILNCKKWGILALENRFYTFTVKYEL